MNTVVAVRLTSDTIEAIDSIAKEKGRLSSQEIIREAISDYLERERKEKTIRELHRIAGSLKGKTRQLTHEERDEIVRQITDEVEKREKVTKTRI